MSQHPLIDFLERYLSTPPAGTERHYDKFLFFPKASSSDPAEWRWLERAQWKETWTENDFLDFWKVEWID